MLRWIPPSKRITTRARVVNTGPTLPKSAGVTIPKAGPMTMPASMSTSTSGTLVRSKKPVRKWPAKTKRPMLRMVISTGQGYCWA